MVLRMLIAVEMAAQIQNYNRITCKIGNIIGLFYTSCGADSAYIENINPVL